MRVLVVEDERSLSDILVTLLEQNGIYANAVYDGGSALDEAESLVYDAIILDIMLPVKNGLEVLRQLRSLKNPVPILLLTAKSEIEDKISGLDLGADDYLTKPFATGELLARLRAITRRKGEVAGDELSVSDVTLNKRTHELSFRGVPVKLGLKEYQIMEMLFNAQNTIIPKERFIEKIWGFDTEAEYNAIEVYISFLRKKIQAIGANIQIKAVRGAGYSLEGAND